MELNRQELELRNSNWVGIGILGMDIKKSFAKHFPIKKLIHAFRNSRGKIHLEFDSADTAADIKQNWNKDAMGTDTSITSITTQA